MMNPGCFGPGRLLDQRIMEEPAEMTHCLGMKMNMPERQDCIKEQENKLEQEVS